MGRASSNGWVWFDFENTPHVLFLEPLVRRLAAGGERVAITAKPQGQTLELATKRGLETHAVGAGDFAGLLRKVVGGLRRAAGLGQWVRQRGKPKVLVSSSRSASIAAWWLGVPALSLLDYEHAEQHALGLASRSIWLPDVLRDVDLPRRTRRVARFYEGLKENLYLDDWPIDRTAQRSALGVGPREHFVVARPPAGTAHYASAQSLRLWLSALRHLAKRPNARIAVVARTHLQRGQLMDELTGLRNVTFLQAAVSGPELVAAADLVVGGGGTMNREAAVLGVPVWSVFTGPSPRVDETLAAEGRLRWVRTEAELEAALGQPPSPPTAARGPFRHGLQAIMQDIEAYL